MNTAHKMVRVYATETANSCRGRVIWKPSKSVWMLSMYAGAMCTTGHWLMGYMAHRWGDRKWDVKGAGVQGYNVPGCGLITVPSVQAYGEGDRAQLACA